MIKLLLVRPKPHKETIGLQHVMICEPLELEYIVSNLCYDELEIEVSIFDGILEKRNLNSVVIEGKYNMVVFTGYNTHVNVIKALAKNVKAIDRDIVTAVGGVHVEVVPEDFKSLDIDILLWKNGIDALNYLIKHYQTQASLLSIQEWIDSQIRHNTFDYKYPDRGAVSKYRSKYYYMFHNPCALIKTSYGCPFNCSFCFCKEITEGKYYARDIEDVIGELKLIPQKEIYIVDDDFLYSRERVALFIRRLKEEALDKHFLIYGRADFIVEHADLIESFKAVGLHAVIVGIESVREGDLLSYNKKTSIEINERALEILRENDVECYGTLIIPLDFKKKDFSDLKKWLKKNQMTFVNLQPLTPLKGTEIYNNYVDAFIEDPHKFERWDMAHVVLEPKHLSKRGFYIQLLKLYYDIVMQPKNVIRLIKKYGLRENVKLFMGSSRVSIQYMIKILWG